MDPLLVFAVVATAVLVVVAVVLGVRLRPSRGEPESLRTSDGANDEDPRRPEGYWQGVGMGTGIAIGGGAGVAIGVALDELSIGIAIGAGMGVALGAAFGTSLEARHQGETRPLTPAERRRRSILLGAALALGLLAFLLVLLALG